MLRRDIWGGTYGRGSKLFPLTLKYTHYQIEEQKINLLLNTLYQSVVTVHRLFCV